MGGWVALLSMDEAWEKDGVPNKEDGGVVANQIPVTLLSIELDSKASRISVIKQLKFIIF